MLPQYRLAIYERLAKAEDIDLTVYYSREPKYYSLKTVDPGDRFPHQRIEMKTIRVGNQELLFQPEIKNMIAGGRHDVVILSANPRLLSNFPALYAARRKRIGTVWWSLGLMANQSPVTIAIRRWLMHIPDAIALYTTDERDYFVRKGVPSEKVFVAQNTIDVTAEKHAAETWTAYGAESFLAEQGLSSKTLFLFCARLRQIKRVDLILRAMSMLRKDRPDIHLVVIGEGELQAELKELASQLKLDGSISWLGSVYEAQKLAPWYLASKALVIPTGIGLAAFQSFAYGLPCITTANRHKQSPEATALMDGYNCLMFEDENIRDIAEKMRLVASDGHLQQRLSRNARRTMDEEYTVDKMIEGFVQAIHYAKACASR